MRHIGVIILMILKNWSYELKLRLKLAIQSLNFRIY